MMSSPYNFEVIGSATDSGIANFFMDITSAHECYDKQRELTEAVKLLEVPFNSRLKKCFMAVRKPDCVRIYCKGASELVLENCRRYLNNQGQLGSLDEVCTSRILSKLAGSNE